MSLSERDESSERVRKAAAKGEVFWGFNGSGVSSSPFVPIPPSGEVLVQSVLLLVQFTVHAADDPHPGATAFVGATVIDGTGNRPREDAVVLVFGEHIRAVGPRGEVIIPEGARLVDATENGSSRASLMHTFRRLGRSRTL